MGIRSIRPALSPYIANDQTGYLWITTILGVIYTFLVAVARLYVKFRALGIDDYLLGFATVSFLFAFRASATDRLIPGIFRYFTWSNLSRFSFGFGTVA